MGALRRRPPRHHRRYCLHYAHCPSHTGKTNSAELVKLSRAAITDESAGYTTRKVGDERLPLLPEGGEGRAFAAPKWLRPRGRPPRADTLRPSDNGFGHAGGERRTIFIGFPLSLTLCPRVRRGERELTASFRASHSLPIL